MKLNNQKFRWLNKTSNKGNNNNNKKTCEASNGKANPRVGGLRERSGGRGTARGLEDGGSGKEMEAREGEAGRWGRDGRQMGRDGG